MPSAGQKRRIVLTLAYASAMDGLNDHSNPCIYSFFATLALLLIGLSQIQAVPAPSTVSQSRNLVQFGNMIGKILGTSALSYNNYGCWCGFGGKGTPVDGTDACCKAHDECYDEIIDSRSYFFSCSPYLAYYSWDLDPSTGLLVCKDAPGSCTHRVCECDRIVTECYKQHAETFDKSRKCPK